MKIQIISIRSIFFLLILFTLTACAKTSAPPTYDAGNAYSKTAVSDNPNETGNAASSNNNIAEAPPALVPPPAAADEVVLPPEEVLLRAMTTEEKIGQLLIVHLELLQPSKGKLFAKLQSFTDEMGETLQAYSVGGVIFFGRNMSDQEGTKKFISDLKQAAAIPIFVAIDEEGGGVSRLSSVSGYTAPVKEHMQTVGATQDPARALSIGQKIGEALADFGFNLNFAPVADVQTDPANKVIGARSFGSDPDMVGQMVSQMIHGLHAYGILTAAKHFPGHGDASADTHIGASVLPFDMERLEQVELVPFQYAIKAETDMIMAAHIKTPEATGNDACASLSYEMLTGVLRNKLGYDGIIVTDALDMKAITNEYSPGEAAVAAFLAGADILLMPSDLAGAYHHLLDAVNNGDIAIERVDQSVQRILRAKIRAGIIR